MSVLLSLIIPCYNREKYIKPCLNSILESLSSEYYSLLELIIVNDGSTDQSESIIKEFIKMHPYLNIQYVLQENSGQSVARNVGITLSKGEYIGFLDSDDIWYPKVADILIDTLKVKKYDLIEIDASRFIKDPFSEPKEGFSSEYLAKEYLTHTDKLISIFQMSKWFVWTRFYKKELLEHIFFEEGRRYEDAMFTPLVCLRAKNIYSIPEVLVGYRLNREGITQNINQKDVIDLHYALNFYIAKLSEYAYDDFEYQLLSIHLINLWMLYRKFLIVNKLSKKKEYINESNEILVKVKKIVNPIYLTKEQMNYLKNPFFMDLKLSIILFFRDIYYKFKA